MTGLNDPDKAWLRRVLGVRTAEPVLATPERRQTPPEKAAKAAPASSASIPDGAPPPPPKPPEPTPAPFSATRAQTPQVPNVGPGRQREIKPSEHMAAVHAYLIEQAKDWADAMPRHASDDARAEVNALWKRIGTLGELVEEQRTAEKAEAQRARQRGGEREL